MVASSAGDDRMSAFVVPNDPDYLDSLVFLMAEAELLDAADFTAWLEMLSAEMSYRVPVQTTQLRDDLDTGCQRGYHVNDDRSTLDFRVKRIVESNSAWTYNPQPRTRRFISNLRVRRTESGDLDVSSYLLLMRSRHDRAAYEFITGERNDLLARADDGRLELKAREVLLDQATLGIAALPFPL